MRNTERPPTDREFYRAQVDFDAVGHLKQTLRKILSATQRRRWMKKRNLNLVPIRLERHYHQTKVQLARKYLNS